MSGDPSGRGEVTIENHPVPMKARSEYFAADGARPALRFMVAIDSAPFVHTERQFERELIAWSSFGVVLVAVLGYWAARLGLLPLQRISQDAQRIDASNRAPRLDTAALPTELSDLGRSFNGALDRLDSAYQKLEAFNADVTHELRTPLANLIGQTQVALSRERTAAELEETLQSNLEELERLRTIIADMLFLARADQGEKAMSLAPASLDDEVQKTVEFLDLITDEAGVTVRIEGARTRRSSGRCCVARSRTCCTTRSATRGRRRDRRAVVGDVRRTRRSRSRTRVPRSRASISAASSTASIASTRPARTAARTTDSACRSSRRSHRCTPERCSRRASTASPRSASPSRARPSRADGRRSIDQSLKRRPIQ